MTNITLKLNRAGKPFRDPNFSINNSKTIGRLKRDIEVFHNIPSEQQLLLYYKDILLDHRTIESYGIQNGHRVQLIVQIPGAMPVTFCGNGKEVILRLRMNDTVIQIKEQLAAKGLNANYLTLGETRIDDDLTVATSGLYAFSVVNCT